MPVGPCQSALIRNGRTLTYPEQRWQLWSHKYSLHLPTYKHTFQLAWRWQTWRPKSRKQQVSKWKFPLPPARVEMLSHPQVPSLLRHPPRSPNSQAPPPIRPVCSPVNWLKLYWITSGLYIWHCLWGRKPEDQGSFHQSVHPPPEKNSSNITNRKKNNSRFMV